MECENILFYSVLGKKLICFYNRFDVIYTFDTWASLPKINGALIGQAYREIFKGSSFILSLFLCDLEKTMVKNTLVS